MPCILRDNFCPICRRRLCKGLGPVEIKCAGCKATVLIEPAKMTIVVRPKYEKYLSLYSLGKVVYDYDQLNKLEIGMGL